VVLATAVSAWLAWRGVRAALESDFERRLLHMAAAQQVSRADIAEIARLREESNAYLAVQAQLNTLRSATDAADVSLVDSAGVTLFDAASRAREGEPSPLAHLGGGALARALGGHATVSAPYRLDGRLARAAFAPVRDSLGVAGAVAVEAEAAYLPAVAALGRTLAGIALVTLLAVAVLAALVLRGAAAASRLERRLSRAENLAAMGRLTATLAHEIKNPLAVIRGSAERLAGKDPEARRMADFVIEESDRLSRTVARYLEFARPGARADAHDTAAESAGDAARALEATLALLEGELLARRVTLEREAPFPEQAPVALDHESLKQLYLNLVLNALEAMEHGGRLRVGLADRSGTIETTVSDNGAGMAPEVLAQVGNPFFTTKATGTGLGLFLARRLAESAGGRLAVESATGSGTTCTVRFPRRKA